MPLGGTVPVLKKWSRVNKFQKSVLEELFVVNCYPSQNTINELELQTGMDRQQLRTWFRHQRWKKGLCKGEETQ